MAALRWIAIIIVALALIALGFWQAGIFNSSDREGMATVEIKGERFALEIAADAASVQRGLMFRESIEPDGGMIFVFPRLRYPNFWMKNCLIDIDLLYLDDVGRVVTVHEMKAQPLQQPGESDLEYEERLRLVSYPSDGLVRFAIELKAGTIDRLGIQPGDSVSMDLRGLKRMAR